MIQSIRSQHALATLCDGEGRLVVLYKEGEFLCICLLIGFNDGHAWRRAAMIESTRNDRAQLAPWRSSGGGLAYSGSILTATNRLPACTLREISQCCQFSSPISRQSS